MKKDIQELRINYPYGLYQQNPEEFYIVNREYSDLGTVERGIRTPESKITLNPTQHEKLAKLCGLNEGSGGYFLYNDGNAPWRKQNCAEYIQKLAQFEEILNY